ncbi:DMT family transporter [Paenibacillus cymbidii]
MGVLLVLWGSFAAIGKLVLGDLDSYQLQFYMFGFGFIGLGLLVVCRPELRAELARLRFAQAGKLALLGVLSYLYYFFYTKSLGMIPVVEASMLNYMFPLFIVLLGITFFGEKPTLAKLAAIVAGVVGMIVIVTGGQAIDLASFNLSGDLLALGGAMSWALFSHLTRRSQTSLIVANFIYTASSFALSAISLFVTSSLGAMPGFSALSGLVWLGLSNLILGNLLWIRALKRCPPSLVASLSFVTPFFTLLFIWLLLGESLSAAQFIGFGIVIAGLVLHSFDRRAA